MANASALLPATRFVYLFVTASQQADSSPLTLLTGCLTESFTHARKLLLDWLSARLEKKCQMCEEKTLNGGKKKKKKWNKEAHKASLHRVQACHVTSAAISSVRLAGWSRCRNVFH